MREELAGAREEVHSMKEDVKELKTGMKKEKEERLKGMEDIEHRLKEIEEKAVRTSLRAPGIGDGSLIAVVGRFGPLKKADALAKVGNALNDVWGFKSVSTEMEEPNIAMAEFEDEDSLMMFLRSQNTMTESTEKMGMLANRHKEGLP